MKHIKVILVISLIFILSLSGCIETGKGTSTDTIYGIEYSGLIWKTYSIYLTNDHPSSGKDEFSGYSAIYTVNVNNINLINKLKIAESSNKKMKIHYHNELIILPPWEYTSNAIAIIDDITIIE